MRKNLSVLIARCVRSSQRAGLTGLVLSAVMALPLAAQAETSVMLLGGNPWLETNNTNVHNTEGARYVARSGPYTVFGAEWDDQDGDANEREHLGSVSVYADGIKDPVAFYTFQGVDGGALGLDTWLGQNVAVSDKWIVALTRVGLGKMVVAQREGAHWQTCPKVGGYTRCDGALKVVTGVPTTGLDVDLSVSGDLVAVADPSAANSNGASGAIRLYRLQSMGTGANIDVSLASTIPAPANSIGFGNKFDLDGNRLVALATVDGEKNLYIYQLEGGNWVLKASNLTGGDSVSLKGNQLAVSSSDSNVPVYNYTYFADLNAQGMAVHFCTLNQDPGYGSVVEVEGRKAVLKTTSGLKVFSRQDDGQWVRDGALAVPTITRRIPLSNGKVASGLWDYHYALDGFPLADYGGVYATDIADAACPQFSSVIKPVAATASSIESASYGPEKAIDGVDTNASRWSSQFVNDAWIKFDLGSTRAMDRMTISWEAAYSKRYDVQMSSDNSHWGRIYSETAGAPGLASIDLRNYPGRYVRIRSYERGTQWGVSVKEVKFYSAAAAGCSVPTEVLSCSGTPLPASSNMLQNGDFASGNTGWKTYVDGAANAAFDLGGQFQMGTVSIWNGGNQTWHVQLMQGNLNLQKGGLYEVSFDATSSSKTSPGRADVIVEQDGGSYTAYSGVNTFYPNPGVQHLTYTFTMNNTSDTAARLTFNWGLNAPIGNGVPSVFSVDNVALRKLN